MGQLDRSEMCVLSQAHAVAMMALIGRNPTTAVLSLESMAGRLPEGHPMRAAVARFREAQGKRLVAVDTLREAGRALRHAVDLCLMPAPVGQDRADIHG